MSEPNHQHPVAAITQVLDIIKQNFIAIIIFLFVGSGGQSFFSDLFGILPIALFLLVAGTLKWWRFTYQIIDGELHIERGIFVRRNLYLSPDRIQVIDINAGLIQRMFGLVSVEVKTADQQSKGAKINAVTQKEAERIKAILPNKQNTAEPNTIEAVSKRTYTLDTGDLLKAAATSGNITLTLALIGGALSQVLQFMDEQQIAKSIEYIVPTSFELNIAIWVVVAAIAVSWLFSFVGTIVRYYDFELTIFKDELHVKSGLFTQKQSTVPFNRIQGIRVKEELVREPFGLAAIIIESAGYGERDSNATTLFPLIHTDDVAGFLDEVLPEYNVSVDKIRPSGKSLRRYILRPVWFALGITFLCWLWIPYGIWAAVLLVPAIVLGYAQYKDAAIGVDDNTMVIRRRLLSRTTAVVKNHRVMAAQNRQNPFQKRLSLCSFDVTIASGNKGRTFIIRDLDEDDPNLFPWITATTS